jgi:hypothetical protein
MLAYAQMSKYLQRSRPCMAQQSSYQGVEALCSAHLVSAGTHCGKYSLLLVLLLFSCACRRLLQRMVSSSRWLPGLSNLAEFAFNMVEGMQSYYTYVEC